MGRDGTGRGVESSCCCLLFVREGRVLACWLGFGVVHEGGVMAVEGGEQCGGVEGGWRVWQRHLAASASPAAAVASPSPSPSASASESVSVSMAVALTLTLRRVR